MNSNAKKPFVLWTAAACTVMGLTGCGKKDAPTSAPATGGASTGAPVAAASSLPRAALDSATTRQQLENGPLEPACSLEAIVELPSEKRYAAANAVYTIPRDITAKLIGFGTHKSKGTDLGAFTAYLASTTAVYKVAGETNLDRPDVVTFFSTPGMLKAGFQVDVDLKDVPAGDYMVYLHAASGTTCPTHHTVRIS